MKRSTLLTILLTMTLLATACHHHGHRRRIQPVQKHYIDARPKPTATPTAQTRTPHRPRATRSALLSHSLFFTQPTQ